MVINTRSILILIGTLIIVGLGFLSINGILLPALTSHLSYTTPYGILTVPSSLPETPDNLTLYKVTSQPDDMVYYSVKNLEQNRPNTTSEADAPSFVQKSLEPYGGLPNDAKITLDETEYLEEHRSSIIPFFPPEVIARDPISTNVQYSRIINGHQITGDGGFINIELGNNGELLYLDKVWRTVTPSKTVPIISASQAIVKMQRGEILGMRPKCSCELTVTKIIPTYYEKGRNVSQEYLDPVWVFAGTLSDGNPWHYAISAWQFANFTGTPYGSTPLSIRFADTSEASPMRWLWDFGDGTTATDQNPVHSYKTAGTYIVTLTAWNDLGSDTITKNILITNNPIESSALNTPLNTTPGVQGTGKKI
jgi:hypothetical protein